MEISDVVKYYRNIQSIKGTARHFNCSVGVVRKCLITAGEYSSHRSAEIQSLIGDGMSVADVALKLGLCEATVNNYIPYQKGTYLTENKSQNAMRIKKCRNKKII